MLLPSRLLAFTLPFYTAVLFSWSIPLDDDSGILYRFSPASSDETEELLSWAEVRLPSLRQVKRQHIWNIFSLFLQLREWDLWQMTHSHVDVYFPRRAIAEAELGLLPFRLPPGTSHRMDQVKRTSSCSCAHDLCAEHTSPCSHITTSEAETRWDVVSPSNATFHARYHPLDEIQSFVRDLAAAYPKQVTIVPIGHSGEGREMFALEISASSESAPGASGAQASAGHRSHDQNPQIVFGGKGKERGTNPRCGFLVTGAQHAREVSYVFLFCLFEARDLPCSLVGCFCCCVVHRTRPPGRPVREVFSRPSTRATCTCCQFCAENINADEEHRIFILFLFRTQMDMYIHGKKTDFGGSIPLFVPSICG